ncbi:MAG: thioredoxin family protein [Dehalococcoidales bacterium]|nr:thioredoxin family protein [Dehalococcoidales bacterium]
MEIVVIGTEPPCIRCATTFKRAKEAAQKFSDKIEVKKIAIHSEEAARYGNVESGHGIGDAGKIQPDVEGMKRVMSDIDELVKDEAKNEKLIDARLKELEKILVPVKEKAREMGYLMTPVLVINGQVKSMDYVPSREEIQAWIEIERRR